VTVVGAEAPHSVLYSGNADDPEDAEKLLSQLAVGLANMATNNAILTGGAGIVVLNPEHADILAQANMSRESVQQRLFELTRQPRSQLLKYGASFAGRREGEGDYDTFSKPEDILVLTAGGSGLYSMVMPTWCAGAHKNSAVSVQVETDQFCEIPG